MAAVLPDRSKVIDSPLNTLDGKVIGLCQERHRHQEWFHFLRLVDKTTPSHKQLPLIVDNYATHKHPTVQRWQQFLEEFAFFGEKAL